LKRWRVGGARLPRAAGQTRCRRAGHHGVGEPRRAWWMTPSWNELAEAKNSLGGVPRLATATWGHQWDQVRLSGLGLKGHEGPGR
jgi:hypothetical protein